MRRTFGILLAVVLMVTITSNLFAQEMMMKKMGKEKEATEAGAKKAMGGKGMMIGGMMCPMYERMMGEKGMMGGGMMPMMQGMMGGMDMMDMESNMAGMAQALNLSEEQHAKLKVLHIAHQKDMIRKKAEREIAGIDLQELVQKDDLDLDAIEAQIRAGANLEAEMKIASFKLLADSKSLLTAEQKAELKKLMKDKRSPMMMDKMMGVKKAKPGPKDESGDHSKQHK